MSLSPAFPGITPSPVEKNPEIMPLIIHFLVDLTYTEWSKSVINCNQNHIVFHKKLRPITTLNHSITFFKASPMYKKHHRQFLVSVLQLQH